MMLHLNMMKNYIIQKIQAVNLSETNNIDYLEYNIHYTWIYFTVGQPGTLGL